MKQAMRDIGFFSVWWVWAVILLVVSAGAFYFVQPYFIAKETQTIRQSNSYVTTQQTALTKFRAEYDQLEVRRISLKKEDASKNAELIRAIEGQQAGIVRQMKEVAALIPDHVQPAIRQFLAGH